MNQAFYANLSQGEQIAVALNLMNDVRELGSFPSANEVVNALSRRRCYCIQSKEHGWKVVRTDFVDLCRDNGWRWKSF